MRPFQKDVLEQIEKALTSTRFVILEAPVGFGKSAVATSVCRYLGSAHILTSSKQLQDQYASDFKFPIVKGKSNFRCHIPSSSGMFLPCSKGRCEADWNLMDCPHYITLDEYQTHKKRLCTRSSRCERLKGGKLCRYYEQKWIGFSAPVTIYNYPFVFSELKYAKDVPHRRLLVCDEVHDLEKQIVAFASFTFRRAALQTYHEDVKLGKELTIPDKGVDEPSAWLDVLTSAEDTLKEFFTLYKSDGQQERIITCETMLEELENFIKNLQSDPSNWVVNSVKHVGDGSVEEVVFQPISISSYTLPLFNIADKVLLMSATVSSKERLCGVLGISEQDATFINISESIFPVENRPIHALNVAKLNRASMDSALPAIVQTVDDIMNRHRYERGVIHTTSYLQSNYIMQHISEPNRLRLVTTEGSFNRSTLVQIHSENDASVLISPSLYQGVDLKDDLSRFQIIVKVPYPDLSHRRIAVKLQRDREWYYWQTVLRLVQTYGRSVRSEHDHAVTYVLDSNFTSFINMHNNLFPKFFLDALTKGLPVFPQDQKNL
jgi:ATP-dependent DNA helicase DinG